MKFDNDQPAGLRDIHIPIEKLKNYIVTTGAFRFDWLFILAAIKANHKSLNEFEFLQDPSTNTELAALEVLEN